MNYLHWQTYINFPYIQTLNIFTSGHELSTLADMNFIHVQTFTELVISYAIDATGI